MFKETFLIIRGLARSMTVSGHGPHTPIPGATEVQRPLLRYAAAAMSHLKSNAGP